MSEERAFQNCPRCGEELTAGLAHKSAGLSFVTPDKLQNFIFVDEDVAQAGWSKIFPSAAAFFRSYLCRSCELYIVDYSQAIDRAEASQIREAADLER